MFSGFNLHFCGDLLKNNKLIEYFVKKEQGNIVEFESARFVIVSENANPPFALNRSQRVVNFSWIIKCLTVKYEHPSRNYFVCSKKQTDTKRGYSGKKKKGILRFTQVPQFYEGVLETNVPCFVEYITKKKFLYFWNPFSNESQCDPPPNFRELLLGNTRIDNPSSWNQTREKKKLKQDIDDFILRLEDTQKKLKLYEEIIVGRRS